MTEAQLNALLVAAYHEAGHAVVAVRLGVAIGRRGVSIVPGDGLAGSVHTHLGFSGNPDQEITTKMRMAAEHNAIICFAGEAAQRRFSPKSVRRIHWEGDRENAALLVSYFTGPDPELEWYLGWLRTRAENIVATPHVWVMITAVAEALMEHKRLTAGEVKAVCRGCGWQSTGA